MSLKLGTQDIAGISQNKICNAHFLLEAIWSDHIINDISFLRADTFSWQSGGVYTSAYNHLVQDIQGITAETETIGSYTVTFYRGTDGHKICLADQEQTVLNIYNTYGIAWYYILDTTNTQFKLPRTKYGFEGLRNNVGDLIEDGLPYSWLSHTHTRGNMNITGSFNLIGNEYSYPENYYSSGSFTGTTSYGNVKTYENNNNTNRNYISNINFNGANSWSGSTSTPNYSDSSHNNSTVQPPATQMYLYFYVGDYSQTAIEQTAGLNSELFNGKADNNLANVNDQAKILMGGMAMPSNKYIDLTLGASGSTYTAPADGWFMLATAYNGTHYITLDNQTSLVGCVTQQSSGTIKHSLPAKKGDIIYVEYNAATSSQFKFIYAQGSESEAQ